MPDSKRTTRSKQTDSVTEGTTQGAKAWIAQAKRFLKCYVYTAGIGHKKQKQEKQTSPRQTAAKGRKKPQSELTQATVDSLAEVKAEQSDVKLVDPNTGEEVKAKHQSAAQPAEQAASKPKSKKGTKIINPNSGKEVDAAAEQINKPAMTQQTGTSSAAKKNEKSAPAEAAKPESASGKEQFVKINRAPVLTLWVAVVAERQGFSKEAGMTFGKAISGMLAQSKGR